MADQPSAIRRWLTHNPRPARPLFRALAAIVAIGNAAAAVYLAIAHGWAFGLAILPPNYVFSEIALRGGVRRPNDQK